MCDFPRLAHDIGIDPETGKHRIKFLGHPDLSFAAAKEKYGEHLLQIPCGKCPSCVSLYRRVWSTRCMLESLYHFENCFLTLTFDPVHLPSDVNGVRREVQLFLKRIRKKYPLIDVRYFGCIERGGETKRLHAHLVLFGLSFEADSWLVGVNELKQQVKTSKELLELWKNGFANFGSVTRESCSYVAGYSMKKKLDLVEDNQLALMMSTRPAIGKRFYDEKKQLLYLSDRIYSLDLHGVPVPRYFDKLAQEDDLVRDLYECCKKDRIEKSKALFASSVNRASLPVEEFNIQNIKRGLQRISHLKKRSL